MQKDEKFQDWLFRYSFVYRTRRTKKNKQRFLSALFTDLYAIREDVNVVAYNYANYHSRNVYVGDIENADKIICTYYDTPLKHIGKYRFFDRKGQRNQTLFSLILGIVLLISAGIIGTVIYMRSSRSDMAFFSTQTILFACLFGIYFYFFGKTARGLSNRQTAVRNTSSILTMLKMIDRLEDPSIAYAFIDEGCYGDEGLQVIRDSAKKTCQFFFLDSVGANAPLRYEGNYFSEKEDQTANNKKGLPVNRINYIYSARIDEQTHAYYLSKKDLKRKSMDLGHMEEILELFS